MVRGLAILLVTLVLVGCGSNPIKKETETQQVNKPILYCPAPQDVQRPTLIIRSISPEDDDGQIVKKYKATVKQLLDYSKQLEQQLNKYDQTSEAYQQLREQFKRQREQDQFSAPEGE